MNKWQKLVEILESDKVKRKEIALALGSKGISKGVHNLMAHVRNKSISIDNLKMVAPLLGLDTDEVISDYQETKRIIKKEKELNKQIEDFNNKIKERDNFKPYIYIQTSISRPTFITGAALFSGSMKYIRDLPENILELSKNAQIEVVKGIVNKHYVEKEGKCTFFGDIIAYSYFFKFKTYVSFSITGEVIDYEKTVLCSPEGQSSIYFKGKKI